jgi:hypothetical protein
LLYTSQVFTSCFFLGVTKVPLRAPGRGGPGGGGKEKVVGERGIKWLISQVVLCKIFKRNKSKWRCKNEESYH